MASAVETSEAPWYAAFPEPKSVADALPREEVLKMLRAGKTGTEKDFVLIDLRRNDYGGGAVRGSVNLPAQSMYTTLPAIYDLFKAAGLRKVIWYCNSCGGRGVRSAGWFADYLVEKGDDSMQSYILEGGIKGWIKAGSEYIEMMDGYEESFWNKGSA